MNRRERRREEVAVAAGLVDKLPMPSQFDFSFLSRSQIIQVDGECWGVSGHASDVLQEC